MDLIKKIIGLIIIIGIIFMLLNAKNVVSNIGNIANGSGRILTPFQVGTSYVEQIEAITPKMNYDTKYTGSAIGYGSFSTYTYDSNGVAVASKKTKKNQGRATLEKNNTQLILYTENITVTTNTPVHFWLANTQTILNETEYVDFGQAKMQAGIQTYVVDMNSGDLDLTVYKYLMIVDPTTFTIHAVALLGK